MIPNVSAAFTGKTGRYFRVAVIFGEVKKVCNSKRPQIKITRIWKPKSNPVYAYSYNVAVLVF